MSLIPCSSVLPDSHIQSLVLWRLVHIFSSIIGDVLTGIFRLVRVGDSLHQRSKGGSGRIAYRLLAETSLRNTS